ncbi:MAG TPA: hypothetical protein VGC41_13955 [Kofleriaceae bacterium]
MGGKATKTIKVCLTNRGADRETPWATDLGPVPGQKGSRRVRLVNVPFLHAKPTWGDILIVTPVHGQLEWDRAGVAESKITTRILDDGGRWAMIVEYTPRTPDEADECFDALAEACSELEVVCEGAFGPQPGKPGRAYLAVPTGTSATAVMKALRDVPVKLAQIHPKPPQLAKAPRYARSASLGASRNRGPGRV